MDTLYNKFDNLSKFVKPSDNILNSDSRFHVLPDRDGWTDAFIADFTNKNFEVMKAKAILKGATLQLDKEQAPRIDKIVPEELGEEIKDINIDLENGFIQLKGETLNAYVQPKYLSYFLKVYGNGWFKLFITGRCSPIRVCNMQDELIGLIMPVRID